MSVNNSELQWVCIFSQNGLVQVCEHLALLTGPTVAEAGKKNLKRKSSFLFLMTPKQLLLKMVSDLCF